MEALSMIRSPLGRIGRHCISGIRELGKLALFFMESVIHIGSLPFQFSKIIHQIYFIGMKSVFVICLTAVFTGMVLGLQGYYTLVQFGSEGLLGAAVALSLIRELGPVLTAIMVVGRAGSAVAAEIGIMRISEEIDAIETMDINPIRILVSPKLAAALIRFPLLTALFDVVGILGGCLSGSALLGVSSGIYFSRGESAVVMADITGGFIKSIVFGVLVVTVCCYQGYYTHTRSQGFGAKGVSFSTTSAVVLSSILVLVSDYILTSLLMES